MTSFSLSLLTLAGSAALLVAAAAAADEGRVLVCRTPAGSTSLVAASETPPAGAGDCRAAALPVALDRVRFAQWLPGEPPEGAQLAISGSRTAGTFRPASARFARREPPGREALPLGRNLLDLLRETPFGVEERAATERVDGGLVIRCREGSRPAGVILDPLRGFPRGARFSVQLEAEGAGFAVGLTGRGGTPRSFVPVRPGSAARLPPDPSTLGHPWLVVACPAEAGALTVRRIDLKPEAPVGPPTTRSAWAWEPNHWRERGEDLLAEAGQARLGRLFITVDMEGGRVRDAAALGRFVARARAAAIAIVAVEGDPAMALEEGRALALRRLSALVAYQRQAPPAARLAGVQYDIEPYTLPAYGADPGGILAQWARTIDALGAAAKPLQLDIVLPFWLPGNPAAAGTVLPAAARSAVSITVMAYRSTPEAIQAAAEPMLAWGQAAGRPVAIALEMGPVDDEVTRLYAPRADGDVLVVPALGGSLVLVLDGSSGPAPGRTYALRSEAVAPGSAVSFLGDRARLDAAANDLETIFRSWSAFAGLAFHGLIR